MAFVTAAAPDLAGIGPGVLAGVVVAPEPMRSRLAAALARGGVGVAGAAQPNELPAETADRAVHYGVIACDRLDGRARTAARRLREWWSGVRVVAVVHGGDATVADALGAGFDGLVFAADADAALAATVRGVCAGQFVAPRAAFRSGRRPVLSADEQRLLGMVADGLTNAQIA
ncbi:MAG: hypothetical protein QOK04_281, partial [Solirubrobacteraceae bacterium]|nr:hypothetical protein [Solirubrobacteraceae bacterium]